MVGDFLSRVERLLFSRRNCRSPSYITVGGTLYTRKQMLRRETGVSWPGRLFLVSGRLRSRVDRVFERVRDDFEVPLARFRNLVENSGGSRLANLPL